MSCLLAILYINSIALLLLSARPAVNTMANDQKKFSGLKRTLSRLRLRRRRQGSDESTAPLVPKSDPVGIVTPTPAATPGPTIVYVLCLSDVRAADSIRVFSTKELAIAAARNLWSRRYGAWYSKQLEEHVENDGVSPAPVFRIGAEPNEREGVHAEVWIERCWVEDQAEEQYIQRSETGEAECAPEIPMPNFGHDELSQHEE